MPKKRKTRAPLTPLTGKQKSYLRALAHPLKPVVQVGHQGVTPGLIAAASAALERHELIKIKVSGEAELEPSEIAAELERGTHSQVAQIIGRTLVLYRRRSENPKIVLPRPKAKKAAAPLARAASADADDDEEELE